MAFTILAVSTSARTNSVSSALGQDLINVIKGAHPDATLIQHDLGFSPAPMPFVDDNWISGANSDPAGHTPEVSAALDLSNRLTAEVLAADAIVIATPIYNFSIPACLKAWIDQVVRAGLTFAYSGPGQYKGLVPAGKKAYLVVSSGGVEVGSPYDAATPYLRTILGFIGITDVTIIAADQLVLMRDTQVAKARAEIAALAT